MNNEEPDETYKMLRETAREFSRKHLHPLSDRIDEEDYFPVDLFKSLGKMGFLGITIPEEYGGSVRHNEPIHSPLQSFGKQVFLIYSEPLRYIESVTRLLCAPYERAKPADEYPSSSCTMDCAL